MTAEIVASSFKRYPAAWLRYGGNRHVLIKKIDGKYIVKEASHVRTEEGKPVLRLTGRMFELGDGIVDAYHSPVFAGMIEHFTAQDLAVEVVVAKTLGAWGCWPDRYISIQDGMGGKFKMTQ